MAKLSLIGTLGAAIITTATTVYVKNMDDAGGGSQTQATSAPVTPVDRSPFVSVDQVKINEAESEVIVAGSATANVQQVVVTIGPRESGGQFWANESAVEDGQWSLTVGTPPQLVRPYEITAVPKSRPSRGITAFAMHAVATTTPVSPDQVVDCAEQSGSSCFTGPEWGPPSVYRGE